MIDPGRWIDSTRLDAPHTRLMRQQIYGVEVSSACKVTLGETALGRGSLSLRSSDNGLSSA